MGSRDRRALFWTGVPHCTGGTLTVRPIFRFTLTHLPGLTTGGHHLITSMMLGLRTLLGRVTDGIAHDQAHVYSSFGMQQAVSTAVRIIALGPVLPLH